MLAGRRRPPYREASVPLLRLRPASSTLVRGRSSGRTRYGRALITYVELEDLQPGLRLAGVIPGQHVSVIAVQPHGDDALELAYKTTAGELGERVLGRDAEEKLAIVQPEARPLDAAAADCKLVAECQRIKLAGLFDPMLAVTTSAIRPLPHQLRAVYGELLPRTPLRFLLADDPGAGKTYRRSASVGHPEPLCTAGSLASSGAETGPVTVMRRDRRDVQSRQVRIVRRCERNAATSKQPLPTRTTDRPYPPARARDR